MEATSLVVLKLLERVRGAFGGFLEDRRRRVARLLVIPPGVVGASE
jgi:hypothetical protein